MEGSLDGNSIRLDDEAENQEQLVGRTLVGKIMVDRRLNKGAVKDILSKAWGNLQELQVTNVGTNLFLFTFKFENEALEVVKKEPWYVMGKLISLQMWIPQASVYEIDFSTVHFWVQLHSLPSENMNVRSAAKLLNLIGEVFEIEDPLFEGNLIRPFIRARVRINVFKPLSTGCWVPRRNLPKVWVFIKYERLQDFCYKCGVMGHDQRKCQKERAMSALHKEIPRYGPSLGVPPARSFTALVAKRGRRRTRYDEGPSMEETSQNFAAREEDDPGIHATDRREKGGADTEGGTSQTCRKQGAVVGGSVEERREEIRLIRQTVQKNMGKNILGCPAAPGEQSVDPQLGQRQTGPSGNTIQQIPGFTCKGKQVEEISSQAAGAEEGKKGCQEDRKGKAPCEWVTVNCGPARVPILWEDGLAKLGVVDLGLFPMGPMEKELEHDICMKEILSTGTDPKEYEGVSLTTVEIEKCKKACEKSTKQHGGKSLAQQNDHEVEEEITEYMVEFPPDEEDEQEIAIRIPRVVEGALSRNLERALSLKRTRAGEEGHGELEGVLEVYKKRRGEQRHGRAETDFSANFLNTPLLLKAKEAGQAMPPTPP